MPPIVAFAGRTTSAEKDFPRFTRVARRLVARGARVWIADPHARTWETFADQTVERFAVERWAPVPHAEMADFYRAVAASGGVVLMTSRSEGFGNVAPEAAACGARVAAPDVMGLREAIVDGVTGRLFAADASDDTVADLLHAWMQAPHDPAAVSAVTRATFSASVLAERYLAIYGRRDLRLAAVRPSPAPFRERALLLQHLERQRGWRASFARGSAGELAVAGYAKEALDALGVAFRSAPREFLSAGSLRQLVVAGRHVVARPRPVRT